MEPKLAVELEGVWKCFRRRRVAQRYATIKDRFARVGRGRELPLFWALREVTLRVERGEAVALVGRNGAGKSTLLKLVAGIYKANRGRVRRAGRVGSLIELGIGFHPDFSGEENILISGMLHGLSRSEIRQRLPAIVEFAELGDRIGEPVRTYSSGMFMRLGFSVAIHTDPDILLVDEVLTVGDFAFARKCMEWLEGFRARGGTLLIVSHDVSVLRRWCDRAVLLEEGRVAGSGGVEEVLESYLAGGSHPPRAEAR